MFDHIMSQKNSTNFKESISKRTYSPTTIDKAIIRIFEKKIKNFFQQYLLEERQTKLVLN